MIARITGILEEARTDAVLINTGSGMWYEVRIPACDAERLSRKLGREITLHTIHYIEGNPAGNQLRPRMVGFSSETDREFFGVFTTVKGIGIRKALSALARPVAEIASAIQAKDTKFLITLPEIGRRTAEQIIASLYEKVEAFAGPATTMAEELSAPGAEAVSVLVQLGERRSDAAALVERVLSVAPDLDKAEDIIQHAYRLKAGGL